MGGKPSRLVLGLVTLLLAAACGDDEGLEPGRFRAELAPVNDSGVSGNAAVSVFEDNVRVAIDARGLTPNEVHPQRIHGFEDREASCPDDAQDTNQNGIVDAREAEAAYGESRADLEPFPSASDGGRINERLTYRAEDPGYPFDLEPQELDNLEDQVVVISGMEVRGSYRAQIPVACGTLVTSEEE